MIVRPPLTGRLIANAAPVSQQRQHADVTAIGSEFPGWSQKWLR
jgi:hypothetical protein